MALYGLVPLALVLATYGFSLCQNTWSIRDKRVHHLNFYADYDGAASPKSQQAFYTVIPVSIALFTVASGFALSISSAPVEISRRHVYAWALEDWYRPASWVGTILIFFIHRLANNRDVQVLLVLQALNVLLERRPTKRYTLSLWVAFAALILLVSILAKVFILLHLSLTGYTNA